MKISDKEDIVIGIALGYEDEKNPLSNFKSPKLTLEETCQFFN